MLRLFLIHLIQNALLLQCVGTQKMHRSGFVCFFFSFAAVTAQASTTASIADVVLPHRPVPDFILTNLTAMSAVRVLHEPWYCFR